MSLEFSSPSGSTGEAWARLRFAIIGPLLSSPPRRGELCEAIRALAGRTWRHPVTGQDVQFAFSTIETWFYRSLNAPRDPFGVLRRTPRKDLGVSRVMKDDLKAALRTQYNANKDWSYQLQYDNLVALAKEKPELKPVPSYATILRFMKRHGFFKLKACGKRPGQIAAQKRFEGREVRSYEVEHVGSLWHFDFHHGSFAILTPDGRWVQPILLAVMDDHSRLCCHAQWYLDETTESLVHGFTQAIQKRGVCRAALSDNGAAMLSEEFAAGTLRLGIVHETTLPYSPYQNGKQEVFWANVEGRLMKMARCVENITLAFLNDATQAWVEMEYNRTEHSEIKEAPIQRFVHGPDVSRPSPSSEELRLAFRCDTKRTQRRSDGTVSLEGVRFEIPDSFRHFERLTLRYAHWNLRSIHIVDPRTGNLLAPVYPINKAKNAEAKRRVRAPGPLAGLPTPTPTPPPSIAQAPPLLRQLMREYFSCGLPPAYIPTPSEKEPDR
jgi:putative transposase